MPQPDMNGCTGQRDAPNGVCFFRDPAFSIAVLVSRAFLACHAPTARVIAVDLAIKMARRARSSCRDTDRAKVAGH